MNTKFGKFISPLDIVILVTKECEFISQHNEVVKDFLANNAISVVVSETELLPTLKIIGDKVKLVVTEAEIFDKISKVVPKNILLTSFSLLLANYKGELKRLVEGINFIDELEPEMRVLICECSEDDEISKVKIPKLLQGEVGKLQFERCSCSTPLFDNDLKGIDFIVYGGEGSISENARNLNIPIVSYAVLFAFFSGQLERALELFELEKI